MAEIDQYLSCINKAVSFIYQDAKKKTISKETTARSIQLHSAGIKKIPID